MSLPSPPSTSPTTSIGFGGEYTRARNGSESGTNGNQYNGGSGGSGGGGPGGMPPKPLAHLKDLEERSVQGLNTNQSISHLVHQAEASLKQSDTMLSFRKPDLAYVEYLRAYEIIVSFISRNPGFPDFKATKGPLHQTYWDLARLLNDRAEKFEKIKAIIVNDNKRYGTQPQLPSSLVPGPLRSNVQTPVSKASRPLSVPDSRTFGNGIGANLDVSTEEQPGVDSSVHSEHAARIKPAVSPKPKALHGHAITHLGTNTVATAPNPGAEALNERFARLRMMPSAIDTGSRIKRPDSRASQTSSTYESPTQVTSPTDQHGRASFETPSPTLTNSFFGLKPAGPRAMQNGEHGKNPSSGFSLDAHLAASMPKPPDAAYSPARNMHTPGNIDPPRSSARSMVGTGGRSNSGASVASSHAPSADGDNSDYFPKAMPSRPNAGQQRRKSVHDKFETRVLPERLYDYLKMHNILLIDVGSREEFDQGHVYVNSVICIEPAALRREMSAEDLQDALVLSPEAEQDRFFNRDTYDLVVFYDRSSYTEDFLRQPKTDQDYTLRYLYDALYEFNLEKPLQRPPILLMGGIEAWADLVGSQALAMSNTAARVRSARPVRRVPAPNSNKRLQVPKKRLRDYNPLDAEEEQKWRERARVESVAIAEKPPIDNESESAQVDDAELFLENIDEFNRRFPDANSIGQQYATQPLAPAPPRPPKIPTYPAPKPPSALPSIPTRPAPAAPRMSYSGVNDRSVSQSSQPRTADLPAYVPSHLLPSNLRLPRTGLVNFGVTCYMNATIQALSATTPLSVFFLDDRYKRQVQRDNWKGSKGVLPDLYANLVRSIWKGDVEAIRPSTLRAFCARLNKEWGIDRQQDAKEFFDFIVDCLHEDLNANWSRTPLRALTTEQEIKREKMPKMIVSKKEWERFTHREMSFVTSMFAGQHASRLRCTTCHFTSTTYEAFYSISVEIPRSGTGNILDCLRSYCAEEMLSGDEVWKCPQCNKEREATKQITITRAPQFLVVHFKRFSAGRGESARKVRTPIDFPIRNLDLEPFMLPSPSSTESQAIARDFGAQELKTDESMTPPYTYDAYAVMRHIGTTLTSGHYTCLARDRARKCWRQFNDTSTADFQPEDLRERERLQNEMAYIVFYERKGGK